MGHLDRRLWPLGRSGILGDESQPDRGFAGSDEVATHPRCNFGSRLSPTGQNSVDSMIERVGRPGTMR